MINTDPIPKRWYRLTLVSGHKIFLLFREKRIVETKYRFGNNAIVVYDFRLTLNPRSRLYERKGRPFSLSPSTWDNFIMDGAITHLGYHNV